MVGQGRLGVGVLAADHARAAAGGEVGTRGSGRVRDIPETGSKGWAGAGAAGPLHAREHHRAQRHPGAMDGVQEEAKPLFGAPRPAIRPSSTKSAYSPARRSNANSARARVRPPHAAASVTRHV